MKIAIEASILQRKNKTGVDYYTQCLVDELSSQMKGDQFELGYFEKDGNKPGIKGANISYYPIKNITRRLYGAFFRLGLGLPYDSLAKLKADIAIFPDFVIWPLAKIKKSIVVIYDTAYLDVPQYVAPRLIKYLSRFVPRSAKKASKIITISEYTKKSLMRHYGLGSEGIVVINPAVNHNIFRERSRSEIDKVKAKYGIKKEYLLYLGTIEPRKNIEGIIDAYSGLDESIKNEYELVLAGGKGWLDDEIQKKISSNINKIGYVDEADIPALYSGAKIFLYPSHYEGWGMQILESMACGTPVITANNSSLSEAGGSAAIYINNNDSQDLKDKISLLLNDKTLYSKSVQMGIKHAGQFTWQKSAIKLKSTIEELAVDTA
ncbi:MAG: glycosyltransferase family 1 protein [bacterium]